MKQLCYILYVVVMVGIWNGCSYLDNSEKSKLLTADSLMFINPDSSLRIVNNLGDISKCSESTRAYYALISTQAKFRNNIPFDRDTSIFSAVEYYKRTNDNPRLLAWAHFYASRVFSQLGIDSLALLQIREAEMAALECVPADYRLNGYIYSDWGKLLYGHLPLSDAIAMYERSEDCGRVINDTSMIILGIINIGRLHLRNNHYEKCRKSFEEAIELIKEYPPRLCELPKIYERMSVSYGMEQNYDCALRFINRAIVSDSISGGKDIADFFLYKAQLLSEAGKPDSVALLLDNGRKMISGASLLQRANYELAVSKYEAAQGNFDKAFASHVAYSALRDSVYAERERNKVAELQRKYDYRDLAIESDRLKIEVQRRDIGILWGGIGLLITMLCLLIYAHYQRKKRSEAELLRERGINNASANMRRVFMQHEQHVENMRNKILSTDRIFDKVMKLRDVPVKERISDPEKYALTETEIEHVLDMVNLCYGGFLDHLSNEFKSLTEQDLSLCALIKLGFQSRDIAYLLGVSDNTLKTRKKRLKKEKLGLGLSESLDEWIEGRR